MFIRVKAKPQTGRRSVQIVESSRRHGAVRQAILQHIGVADSDEELLELKKLAESVMQKLERERHSSPNQQVLFHDFTDSQENAVSPCLLSEERELDESDSVKLFELENEDRLIDGPFEVTGWMYKNMGLDGIFTNAKRDGAREKILKQLIAGMMASPASKLGLASWLAKYYTESVSVDSIYRFMDDFYRKKKRVMNIVRNNSESLIQEKASLILFDVTTLYFESFDEGELRQCGFSKDSKHKETQIVLALATTPEGMPLWYETFPGKTWEGHTFSEFVDQWKKTSPVGSGGVVVADCGMFSNVNMGELKKNNLNYVLGAPLKKLPEAQKSMVQDMSGYSECKYEGEILKYRAIERHDGTRVLVTYSENRARKNAFDRKKAVERLLKKMNGKKSAPGEIKGENLIGNKGNKKFIKLVEGEKPNRYVLDEEKIASDALWDGLRGVITDLPLDEISGIREALAHYHSLWRIEESFRINKTTLKIRPMYHWTDNRVKAHVLLCYLVFACMRYLERRIFIQQKEKISPNELREAMLDVESSIFRNPGTGIMYRIPKHLTPLAQKLYRCLGLKRDTKPRELLNVSKYYQRRATQEQVLR